MLKWIRKRLGFDYREIEGRCHKCRKRLPLTIHRISKISIRVDLSPCSEHGFGAATILWPLQGVRPDLIDGGQK